MKSAVNRAVAITNGCFMIRRTSSFRMEPNNIAPRENKSPNATEPLKNNAFPVIKGKNSSLLTIKGDAIAVYMKKRAREIKITLPVIQFL